MTIDTIIDYVNVEDLDRYPCCPRCGMELDWTDCDACGGEGEFDAYEDDPMWYDPGDTEPCHQCGGLGGWYICPNQDCPQGVVEVTT